MTDKKQRRYRCGYHPDILYPPDEGCPFCKIERLEKRVESLQAALRRASGGKKKSEPIYVEITQDDAIAYGSLLMAGAVKAEGWQSDRESFYPEGLPDRAGYYGNSLSCDRRTEPLAIYGRPALEKARAVYTYITRMVVGIRNDERRYGYNKGVRAVMDTLTEMTGDEVDKLEIESFEKLGFHPFDDPEYKARRELGEIIEGSDD